MAGQPQRAPVQGGEACFLSRRPRASAAQFLERRFIVLAVTAIYIGCR